MKTRQIITLCGSTRFHELFAEYYVKLAMDGWTVLTIPATFQVKGENKGLSDITEVIKERLDECHKEKISISDAIFVLNKDGYIGNSTRSEIEWAISLGKKVMYLENSG